MGKDRKEEKKERGRKRGRTLSYLEVCLEISNHTILCTF